MGCCYNNTVIKKLPYEEERVRDIVSKLKICEVTYTELNKILLKIFPNKYIILKQFFINQMSKIFFDQNISINPSVALHRKIFEQFASLFDEKISIGEIFLYIYPFLKKEKEKCQNEFSDILAYYCKDNKISFVDLKVVYLKLFQFYSFKITRILHDQFTNLEFKKKMFLSNKYFYNYSNINSKTLEMLKELDNNESYRSNITLKQLALFLSNKGIYSFSEIRDYLACMNAN